MDLYVFFFIIGKMATNEENSHDTSKKNPKESVQDAEGDISRGITIMKGVIRARDKGIKYDVHWNETGQLIELNGAMLTSYIGALVRSLVPITCDNWRNPQLKPAKDKIWSEIQVLYVMLFVIFDDYIFKLIILTHFISYCRDLLTLVTRSKNIVFN